MSSEHDESAELLEDISMKSDAEKSGSPPPKKFQGPGEHAKPKRRGRRGKKRKQRKASGAAESENQEDSETHLETEANRDWDSDKELDCETTSYNDVIIRPVNVPKAPENSTQFIIDDHNLCHLYMSFETPNPYLTTDPQDSAKENTVLEPAGIDAAYIDIDFEYDPPQDFDNSAYYDKEFEMSYQSNRFDELLRLPRTELISGLRLLEVRVKELSDDLVKENPSPILETLQAKLLELQEKHNMLKDSNTSLTALLAQNEVGSVIVASVEDSRMSSNLSNAKHLSSVSEMDVDQGHVKELSKVSGLERSSEPADPSERTLEGKCFLISRCFSKGIVCSKLSESLTRDFVKVEINSGLDEIEMSSGHEDVKSSSGLGEVNSSSGLGEVNSSSELERPLLRDLPCRDHSCDDSPHIVTSDEHELSAAVLV